MPSFDSEHAPEVALQLFRVDSADFADCMHAALAIQVGGQRLRTFDKGAAKIGGAHLQETP